MASRLFAAAAAAAAAAASSSPSPLARRITRRCVPGFEGRCWYSEKVNLWEDPKNPKRWRKSHFTAATLTVWGVFLYGAFKIYDWKEKTAEVSAARSKRE